MPLPIPDYHPPHQRWVFKMRESPVHTYRNLSDYNGIFNWTMTYRSDSDIYNPRGIFVPYKNVTRQDTLDNVHPDKDYAQGKTGLVSWFVSHCVTDNKREHYVGKLHKFVSVDIYGRYNLAPAYISASICTNNILVHAHTRTPIVMGAPREDLRRFAPPGSYIHVDDFETVEQLANYLQELDADDVAYSRYFRWKQLGEVIKNGESAYCRLCEALHDANEHVKWYDHIDTWWSKTDCAALQKDIAEVTGKVSRRKLENGM
ncbi:PREDICTED: alpha-(1,3)-fucosyltransferase 5-like [Priapulus caudatus]|uniref:Fucosyltransferase n=1 Tax=Priapulus caudatus TaxID=37621 RepID=A0ABM1E5K9_PRICU|nr:PREDICTED: alpha-(1,3)-fucosyltransferase 5-like [Priapulus caudatus]